MNLKKLEIYLRINLLGSGPRFIKKGIYLAAVSQRLRKSDIECYVNSDHISIRDPAAYDELQFCTRHRGWYRVVIHLRSIMCNLGQMTSLNIIRFIHSSQQPRCSVKMQRANSFETMVPRTVLRSRGEVKWCEVKFCGGMCLLSWIYSYSFRRWVTVQNVLLLSDCHIAICFMSFALCCVLINCFVILNYSF